MIVLDTNVFSEPLKARPDESVLQWLTDNVANLAITSITVVEVLDGVRAMPAGRRRDTLIDDIDESFMRFGSAVLPYEDAAAHRHAVMIESRRKSGRPLEWRDGMIASICRAERLPLATRNLKDFVDLDIELIDPWAGTFTKH